VGSFIAGVAGWYCFDCRTWSYDPPHDETVRRWSGVTGIRRAQWPDAGDHSPRRRPPRWLRRIRGWWRGTPTTQAAQTLIGLGAILLVLAAIIVFSVRH